MKDKISSRAYGEFYWFENVLSMVIDANGAVHAAGSAGDEIYYLTDATGSWTELRVARKFADGADRQPAIAVLDDGTVAIAFTRYSGFICGELDCTPGPSDGIYIVDNRGGAWTDPIRVTERKSQGGQLVGRGNELHLLYGHDAIDGTRLRYASNASSGWTSQSLATRYSDTGSFAVGADDRLHVALTSSTYPGGDFESDIVTEVIHGSLASDGTWTEEVVGTTEAVTRVHIVLDDSDAPTVWYAIPDRSYEPDGGPGATYVVELAGGGWGAPELVAPHTFVAAAADDQQAIHLIYDAVTYNFDDPEADTSGDGLFYDTNRAGATGTWRVDAGTRAIFHSEGGFQASSAVAVDAQGRPHILFTKFAADGFGEIAGLWHAVGPGY